MQIVTKLPTKGLHTVVRDSAGLSKIATMRLKWMDYLQVGHNIAQCSRHFDIPERTISYWYKRYMRSRPRSLENESRRPKRSRITYFSQEVVELVRTYRKKRPWGKRKLKGILKNEHGVIASQCKIQKIINFFGLRRKVKEKKKTDRNGKKPHMYSVSYKQLEIPGGLVYMDVKHVRLIGGQKVYLFTAIDHATRILCARAYRHITSTCGAEFLDYAQRQFSFEIQTVGTDNGSEFLGMLEQALKEKQISHVFSSPRSPKQNPFVERVIRVIIEEVFYYDGIPMTMEKLNDNIETYELEYNNIRPHGSLGDNTPAKQLAMLELQTSFYC